MPLAHVVLILNSFIRPSAWGLDSDLRLVSDGARVFACYGNLRLESRFISLLDPATGEVSGHRAVLAASRLGVPGTVALTAGWECLSRLGSLVRTLHALNYLLRPVRGMLLLRADCRPGDGFAPEAGVAWEEILRPCGLVPERICLEIDAGGGLDPEALARVVGSQQARGYGVAADFSRTGIDLGLVREIRPDIVKLPPLSPAGGNPPRALIGILHELGARVSVEGLDTSFLRRRAVAARIDLLQLRRAFRRRTASGEAWPGLQGSRRRGPGGLTSFPGA
jgi:hypothetical protein